MLHKSCRQKYLSYKEREAGQEMCLQMCRTLAACASTNRQSRTPTSAQDTDTDPVDTALPVGVPKPDGPSASECHRPRSRDGSPASKDTGCGGPTWWSGPVGMYDDSRPDLESREIPFFMSSMLTSPTRTGTWKYSDANGGNALRLAVMKLPRIQTMSTR